MTDPRWERYSAAAGLGAAILLAVQTVVAPLYPWYDDPGIRIVSYYSVNASAIRVQVLLVGLAAVLFLWWLGSLRVHLRRTEPDPGRLSAVAFGGGIVAAGIAGFGAVATVAATNGSTPVAREGMLVPGARFVSGVASVSFHELRLLSYTVSWFALAPMLAAVAVIAARHGAFPRWHRNATYGLAILSLGSGLSVLIDTGPFAPGGVFALVLYALFVLWLGVTSWLLVRASEPLVDGTDESAPSPDGTLPLPP